MSEIEQWVRFALLLLSPSPDLRSSRIPDQAMKRAHFIRISRSTIVSLGAIAEVAPLPGGHGEVRLTDGARLEVSRRRFRSLMDRLSRLRCACWIFS